MGLIRTPLVCFSHSLLFLNGSLHSLSGNVLFQTREEAQQEGLIGVNSAGNVLIRVDNTTSGAGNPTFGRNSVKILSNDTMGPGSLLIMDAVHLPFGVRLSPPLSSSSSVLLTNGIRLIVLRLARLLDPRLQLAGRR
jgi:hypothetical protein